MKRVLVTGAAGFIGFHLSKRLLESEIPVLGVDSVNDYYSVQLKEDRLTQLTEYEHFQFERLDLSDTEPTKAMFEECDCPYVVHLAAQAGVRYSIENPDAYIKANLIATNNVLEGCRHNDVKHLVYASSSSVYGSNTKKPFSVHHNVDHPVSLYAATKKSNELMAHCYSHLYQLPTTGLRFFTVYGPWGRPDMALFLFTKAILSGKPIDVYNNGQMRRDFTYVDDIIEAIVRLIDQPATPNQDWSGNQPDPGTSQAPYRIYNIGNHQPTELTRFIEVIENALGIQAEKNFLPMQPGDVPETYADVDALAKAVDFLPSTPIEVGVQKFVDWYRGYYSDCLDPMMTVG